MRDFGIHPLLELRLTVLRLFTYTIGSRNYVLGNIPRKRNRGKHRKREDGWDGRARVFRDAGGISRGGNSKAVVDLGVIKLNPASRR